MIPKSMSTAIRCDDHIEMLVFERSILGKNDELLEFSVMDSYIGNREFQGLFGRLRRAWHAFFAKPIYYAGVVVEEKEQARIFLQKCLDILDADEEAENEQNSTPT